MVHHPKDGKPIFLAAVSGWRPGGELGKEHGMAIVMDDTAEGMVDIHDRRPVILVAEDALEWSDPATPVTRAPRFSIPVPWRQAQVDGTPAGW